MYIIKRTMKGTVECECFFTFFDNLFTLQGVCTDHSRRTLWLICSFSNSTRCSQIVIKMTLTTLAVCRAHRVTLADTTTPVGAMR